MILVGITSDAAKLISDATILRDLSGLQENATTGDTITLDASAQRHLLLEFLDLPSDHAENLTVKIDMRSAV